MARVCPRLLPGLLLSLLGWLLLAPASADINPGGGGERDEDRPVTIVTPVMRPIEGEVRAGQWVDIPVEVVGIGSAGLAFEMVEEPSMGAIAQIVAVPDQAGRALLRFDARDLVEPGVATFRLRVRRRTGGPASAPVEGRVRVLGLQERLFAPEAVGFGQVAIGTSERSVLALENGSRTPLGIEMVLEGEEFAWGAESGEVLEVTIGATGLLDVPLIYRPTGRGVDHGRVLLRTAAGEREIPLRGEGVEALRIGPNSLRLGSDKVPALHPLVLTNQLGEPMTLTIEGGGELGLPEELELDRDEEVRLVPQFETGTARFGGSGTVVIRGPLVERGLAWDLPGQPPEVVLELVRGGELPEVIDFGEIVPGESLSFELVVRNVGGEAGFLQLEVKPPFLIAWDESHRRVEPDGEQRFELGITAAVVGSWEGVLRYGFGRFERELALRAEVVSPEAEPDEGDADSDEAATAAATGESGSVEEDAGPIRRMPGMREYFRSLDAEGRRKALAEVIFAPRPPRRLEISPMVRIDEVTETSLELSWPLPDRDDLDKLDWELAWISSAAPRRTWQRIPVEVVSDLEERRASVRIEGLSSGVSFPLRISARARPNGPLLADSAFMVNTLPPESWWDRWNDWIIGLLIVALVATVGWFVWQRWGLFWFDDEED